MEDIGLTARLCIVNYCLTPINMLHCTYLYIVCIKLYLFLALKFAITIYFLNFASLKVTIILKVTRILKITSNTNLLIFNNRKHYD